MNTNCGVQCSFAPTLPISKFFYADYGAYDTDDDTNIVNVVNPQIFFYFGPQFLLAKQVLIQFNTIKKIQNNNTQSLFNLSVSLKSRFPEQQYDGKMKPDIQRFPPANIHIIFDWVGFNLKWIVVKLKNFNGLLLLHTSNETDST